MERCEGDPRPLMAYADFIEDKKKLHTGRNGRGDTKPYVPFRDLREYWTEQRIREVLNACNPPLVFDSASMQHGFLRIFSLLAYTMKVHYFEAFILHNLRDSHFPLNKYPTDWPDTSVYRELFNTVDESQWMFFPLIFDRNLRLGRRLSVDYILPIIEEEEIRHGDAVRVCRIKLDDSCNSLNQSNESTAQDTFVLKTYKSAQSKYLFDREVKAFLSVHQGQPSKHIIMYFGSFIQRTRDDDTYNLVLELADGGDLELFWRSSPPPKNAIDSIVFWKSFANFLKGLYRIHQHQLAGGNIKPENLLLARGSSDSSFDFVAKIADFGYCHQRMVQPNTRNLLNVDLHGGQTYGAPECSHHSRYTQNAPNYIDSQADIFSMGCVMSEASAWVALGQKGREEYWDLRVQETNRIRTFQNTGHEGCFHGGVDRLKAVDQMHDRIRRAVSPFDKVTPHILQVVQNEMLLAAPAARSLAYQLVEELARIIQNAEEGLDVASYSAVQKPVTQVSVELGLPMTPPNPVRLQPDSQKSTGSVIEQIFDTPLTASPMSSPPLVEAPSSQGFPLSPQGITGTDDPFRDLPSQFNRQSSATHGGLPPATNGNLSHVLEGATEGNYSTASTSNATDSSRVLTLDQAYAYCQALKQKHPTDPQVHKIVQNLKENLNCRYHHFFIDNSPSMGRRASDVHKSFQTLAYLAKLIASNGIELTFASSPRTFHKAQNTKPLFEKMQKQAWNQIPDMFENSLGEFVDKIIQDRLPCQSPPSFWHQLFSPNRRFSSGFISPPRKPLSIFIFTDGRWGRDSVKACGVENPIMKLIGEIKTRGLNRTHVMLQFIRFGKSEDGFRHLRYLDEFGKENSWDMVDTKPFNGNVYFMFIGSIAQNVDDED